MNNQEKMINTYSGMWALWDYENYKNIFDEEEWGNKFINDDDILKEISTSKFVPIYAHINGSRQFKIKVNESLDDREKQYVIATSKPYLLDTNGLVILSGIENILGDVSDQEAIKINVQKGKYEVIAYIIAWDKEPNMKLADGTISSNALPDFVICMNTIDEENKQFCKSPETFEEWISKNN